MAAKRFGHTLARKRGTFSLPTVFSTFKVDGSSHALKAATLLSRRYLWAIMRKLCFPTGPALAHCLPSYLTKVSSAINDRKHFPIAIGAGYLMTTPSVFLDMISNALLKIPFPVKCGTILHIKTLRHSSWQTAVDSDSELPGSTSKKSTVELYI